MGIVQNGPHSKTKGVFTCLTCRQIKCEQNHVPAEARRVGRIILFRVCCIADIEKHEQITFYVLYGKLLI